MKKATSFILSCILIAGLFLFPVKSYAAASAPSAGVVTVSSGYLNVRSGASTSYPIVTSLYKGTYVTLLSKTGDWWYVEYAKGKYGYCHSSYITGVSGVSSTVNIQSGYLNVRNGPGTGYAVISSLYKGDNVLVLSTSGGWSRTVYHGTKTGYVSAAYLSSAYNTYTPVSLNVPSFKQTDARWANAQIGVSGKSIAQIGCATTGVAMIESYRSGKTVYPDAMAKKLTYSSTGNLYWPSDYIAVTNASGYLSGIYNQLKSGKAVLLGAKKSNGSQHWVVVTGFGGGTALSPSLFTINDPGSNSRTNLQQFLNEYPTFYKYFYYK